MLKKYFAHTDVAFTIKAAGDLKHISFTPQTLGSSVYFTRDEAEQQGIESHPWFGRKVILAETIDEEKVAAEQKEAAVVAAESNKNEHRVTSIADAKEYVADRFGISRSQLRSKSAITEAAEANGVTLIWE